MALFSFGTLNSYNWLEHNRKSRQLAELARGDHASIAAEVAAAFPNSPNMQLRYVPLVPRYTAELTGLYSRPVQRRFLGQGVSEPIWAKLQEVYQNSNLDAALVQVEEKLWVQNSVYILPIPDGLRRVKLLVLEPWQVEPTIADPLRADTPEGWASVELSLPAQVTAGQTIYGRAVLSPSEAYREIGGRKVGLYSPDSANPFGAIPLVVLHRTAPAMGSWCAPVNEALLNLAIALCLQESDTELLVHMQSWGQKVIEGAEVGQNIEELAVGADTIMLLEKKDPTSTISPKLTIVQGQPPIAQIVTWQESRIRLFCSMLGISADSFLRVNTSLTASARLFAQQDRQVLRDRVRPLFVRAETELVRLIAAICNLSEPLAIPRNVDVSVTWQDAVYSVDPLHEAQALRDSIALGVTSAADTLAQQEGITRSQALERVKRNLKEAAELAAILTPSEPAGGAE